MNLDQIGTLIEDLVSVDRGAPFPLSNGKLGAWGSAWVPGDSGAQSVLQKLESFLGGLFECRGLRETEAGDG